MTNCNDDDAGKGETGSVMIVSIDAEGDEGRCDRSGRAGTGKIVIAGADGLFEPSPRGCKSSRSTS